MSFVKVKRGFAKENREIDAVRKQCRRVGEQRVQIFKCGFFKIN